MIKSERKEGSRHFLLCRAPASESILKGLLLEVDVNMERFDSSRPLIVAMLLMSMTTMNIHATGDIKCPEVEFLNAKKDVIHTNIETNITFLVRLDNCSINDILIVKISEKMREKCKIIYNASTCVVSELSSSCTCTPVTGLITFVTRFNETGNTTYTWSWRFPGSEENIRNFTLLFSENGAYNITDRSSNGYVFNIIIVGSTSGIFIITVVSIVIILIFCRKRVRNTFNLPPPPTEWLDDCGAHDRGQKAQQVARQYQEVNDGFFTQNFEMSLYTNHSPSPEEWCDPTFQPPMSQDRADLVRQSSGSVYGQVYDALFLQTFADGTAH